MLRGLYEVHVPVRELERSISFYERLGLEVGVRGEAPPSALLVLEGEDRSMVGLWEAPEAAFDPPQPKTGGHHFAFRVDDVDAMLAFLEEHDLEPLARFGEQPLVHAWMPAASSYVEDPDGHLVELIADLPGPPRPSWGSIPLGEWRARTTGEG